MALSRKVLIGLRVGFLRMMDDYVREVIGDDDICVNVWFAEGVPDGSDEDDLISIAEDDDLWVECVECFARCCQLAEE